MADKKAGKAAAKADAPKTKRTVLTAEERIAKAEQDLLDLREKALAGEPQASRRGRREDRQGSGEAGRG